MALQIEERNEVTSEPSLDPVQEHMLGAIVRLDKSRPAGFHHPYNLIHDEIRKHTEGQIAVELCDLRKSRPTLLEHKLIVDNGCGFKATAEGHQLYHSSIVVKPANSKKGGRPSAH